MCRECHVQEYIYIIYREAGLSAMRANRAAGITIEDLHYAMSTVQPSAMREIYIDVPKVCVHSDSQPITNRIDTYDL